jgi:hypothetical protein
MSTMVCIRNVCCWQRPNFLRSCSVRAVHGRGSLETWMAVATWRACETLVAWIPPVLQVPRGSWNWPTWSILLLVSLYSIVIFNLWSTKNICICLLCIFIAYICASLAHTPVPRLLLLLLVLIIVAHDDSDCSWNEAVTANGVVYFYYN